MRDLMMLIGLLFLVPLAFINPLNAYLFWGWTALLSPVYYLFGFMQSFRFNLAFAVIALVLFLFRRNKHAFENNATFTLMLVFLIHTGISVALGYDNNPFNDIIGVQFFKSTIFCLVMFGFVRERHQIYAVIAMVCLGLGFHGVVEGLKVISSGGGHHVQGIKTSMMSDNNHFGVGMVMVIPLLYYMFQYSANKLVRFGAFSAMCLTVITVFGTYSRGGMVAMAVVGGWFLITTKKKVGALIGVLIGAYLFFSFAPAEWFGRIDMIKGAGEDFSFMGRVAAWKISSAIALHNPIFGGGFHALQVQDVWEHFKYSEGLLGFIATPEPDVRAKAAHSIYFEIMGDMGFVGLILFVSIFVNAIRSRYRIKKMIAGREGEFGWALDTANAIMLSIMAYMVGGAAVSLGYFEAPFMMAMLMEMLLQHVRRGVSRVSNASDGQARVVR